MAGDKIGELEISRRALYASERSTRSGKRLDGSKFAEMMDVLAYGARRAAS